MVVLEQDVVAQFVAEEWVAEKVHAFETWTAGEKDEVNRHGRSSVPSIGDAEMPPIIRRKRKYQTGEICASITPLLADGFNHPGVEQKPGAELVGKVAHERLDLQDETFRVLLAQ
jgi:hypothetical protein